MRSLEEIVANNLAAVAQGGPAAAGATQTKAVGAFPRDPLDPSVPSVPDLLAQIDGLNTALLAASKPPTRVNVLQLTLVHRVGEGNIAITAGAPYIEDPTDALIINARNYLLKEFERITTPPTAGQASALWGEFVDAPGEAAEESKIRTPTSNLQIVRS